MSCEVWIYDGRAPELLCRAPTLADARSRWGNSRHAVIFDESGEVVDTKRGADASRLAAIEAARAGRVAPAQQPRPLPRAAATEPMPERPSEPPAQPVEASPEAPETPAKATRPAATRPPLPRRRTASVAGDPLPSGPAAVLVEAASVATAALPAPEPAPASPPDEAEAKVARLQRLLSSITAERDAHRDRADAAAHRIEQLRGEAEGLVSDLGVARHDLAATVQQLNELSDRTRAELAHLAAERDEARALLGEALSLGLAAVTEARAETATVLRQSGELSRQLGALRDGCTPPPPAAPTAELDEAALQRVATRAARLAVRASREDRALRALAESVGGVEALARLVSNVQELLRGWQR